jgi:hypothetical protein
MPDPGFRGWTYRHRFSLLLGMLVFMLVPGPVVRTMVPGARPVLLSWLVPLAFVAMLVSAVRAVSATRRQTVTAVTLVIPTVLVEVAHAVLGGDGLELARNLLGIVALAYVIFVLITHLFRSTAVTADTISAAICVYLLLAILWSFAYSLLDLLVAGSFGGLGAEDGAMRFGSARSSAVMYFSFVTMSTLGYGDITPRSEVARMLASLQAVVGQLYLAILVARLVGMHIAQSATEPGSGAARSPGSGASPQPGRGAPSSTKRSDAEFRQ